MPPLVSRGCPAVLNQRVAYKVYLMRVASFWQINLGLVGLFKCLTMTMIFQDVRCSSELSAFEPLLSSFLRLATGN